MGSTLQPGLRHSAKFEVSRDDIEVAEVKGRAAAKAGLS